MKRSTFAWGLGVLPLALVGIVCAQPLSPMEELGKNLFFDEALSTPAGVACAACHGPSVGFTGPIAELNEGGSVYPGAVHVRFGNRKPPSAAYAGASPPLYYDMDDETWVGGMFWDGRATGDVLGDPLAEQAMGPFLNPLEQNSPQMRLVVLKVAHSDYAGLWEDVWGAPPDFKDDVYGSYVQIAESIAAYERSSEVNPFTSKYDYYLAGEVMLTDQELAGLQLFEGKAMCANCHISRPDDEGNPPLFTDFTYDNLGTPRNPANPFYDAPPAVNPLGEAWVDLGLGGFLAGAGYPPEVYAMELGKQKVPTLRNVDLRPDPDFVKAYGHNGYFKSLEEITHFYNTRDVEMWPPAEFPMNVNHDELGNLMLTPEEEAAVVAFMKTLSDGYQP